ncbi:MAG TPA: metallophosphoesterase family protein [Terriglobia bacterium]|nr:metallophosphoesterase family protein [Terriglobia bacterium]
MRYLIISDIHSNLEGFEQCLEMARGKYDQALCLGDLVGYGPDPNAVIDFVREVATIVIRGNHDKACCGLTDAEDFNTWAKISTLWTRMVLSPERLDYLRALPAGPMTLNGFQLVHGAPSDEDEYIVGPGQALPALQALKDLTVLFGHTHHQGGFMLSPMGKFQSIRWQSNGDGLVFSLPLEKEARYLINPGSVGQPRDGDWRAAFAILDVDQRMVEYYRTPYDLAKTQEKMEKSRLPMPLIRRLELGR